MIPISLVNTTNTRLVNTYSLIAVFVGATSGIGAYSVHALAAAHGTHGRGLRIYLVGRNEQAAKKIFAGCKEVCPNGQFVFVHAKDLALLKNIDSVSEEILALEKAREEKENLDGAGAATKLGRARIDFLVMTQGVVYFDGRRGISFLYCLLGIYYSKLKVLMRCLT
jgi:NAD(P)-dependent dehydrogenase (short-subunit alcohol dehydrogenase family)